MRDHANPGLLVELAAEAEAAGWDGVFVWDHIAREEDPSLPATDPWIAVAGWRSARSGAAGHHGHPAGAAPAVEGGARGGRPGRAERRALGLGVGLGGGRQAEFAAFGEEADPRVRAELLDEGLAILDGLWSGRPFSFEGMHHRISGAQFTPRSVQQPRVPLWVAGRWPNRRPFRRAARWDGVFPVFEGVGSGRWPARRSWPRP